MSRGRETGRGGALLKKMSCLQRSWVARVLCWRGGHLLFAWTVSGGQLNKCAALMKRSKRYAILYMH